MTINEKTAKQRQSIIKASEHILQRTKEWRKCMMNIDNKHQKGAWALGGLLITLTSNLMIITENTFDESMQSGNPDINKDLDTIAHKFNELLTQMKESFDSHRE